jgi:hypothetical protein
MRAAVRGARVHRRARVASSPARLPAYDAEVIQLLPMSDEDTARARLPQIVADGMPADALVPLDHWPTRRGEQPRHVLGEHAVQGP